MDDVRKQYNQLLENLSKELDIPPSKYQQAVERYQAVGTWLEGGAYENCTDTPEIYP
jgi:trans-aconitate methyltransferase